MFWQDILLGCKVDDTALASAVSAALGIPGQEVRIVDAISTDAPAKLAIERSQLEGDYPLHLSIYLNDTKVEREVQRTGATMDRLVQLCQQLGCPILVSDDALSPLTWLRISPSGAVERVTLDAERLEHDEYVVAGGACTGGRQVPLVP